MPATALSETSASRISTPREDGHDYDHAFDDSASESFSEGVVGTDDDLVGASSITKEKALKPAEPVPAAVEPPAEPTSSAHGYLDLVAGCNFEPEHIAAIIQLARVEQDQEHERKLKQLVYDHEERMKALDVEIRLKELEHERVIKELEHEVTVKGFEHARMMKELEPFIDDKVPESVASEAADLNSEDEW